VGDSNNPYTTLSDATRTIPTAVPKWDLKKRLGYWDNRIVPPIFVWMLESGAADIALDAELDAPQRVRGCAKLPIFRYKTVKNSKKRP